MQMFSKKEAETKFDLIIGTSSKVNGDLECEASIRIDGIVNGNITAKGHVILSENGVIHGNVLCDNLEIHGKCYGNVKTAGNINLSSTSTLIGDVVCTMLNTKTGANFQGNCKVAPEPNVILATSIPDAELPEESTYEKLGKPIAVNEDYSDHSEDDDSYELLSS